MSSDRTMSVHPKPRKAGDTGPNLFLAVIVFLAMLLLFLRMVVFVTGHGHHGF